MSNNVQHDVVVTGVPGVPHGGGTLLKAYSRRPIGELVKDEKQFALYVQAMDLMQKAEPNELLSWFQVGGIHGAPAEPWGNVPVPPGDFPGYCTHASVLFPTWHRAYVVLFEQALAGLASRIADRYTGPDAEEWREAAAALRSPYWDWACTPVPPPEVIELATLTVPGPDGGDLVLDPNPLLSYRFQDCAPHVDDRAQTVRCPTSGNPDATNLQELTKSLRALDIPNNPMRDRVYSTLVDARTWKMFSSKQKTKGAFANSLETIHDAVHNAVGGVGEDDVNEGQMADPRVAAFDPMFWLHHTNVDRLLALWQALHPSTWVSAANEPSEEGAPTISPNAHANEDTDLKPFWNGKTTFFKSSTAAVRKWQLLNYDYPEFAQLSPDADVRAAILAEVERLYFDDKVKDDEYKEAAVPHQRARLDWFARVRVKSAKVDSSFTVLLFFGKPPAEERDWRAAENLVGVHAEFVNSRPAQCANCQRNADEEVVTEGFVGLTRALDKRGLYKKPDAEIEKFLKENLEWRIQKVNGYVLDAGEIDGLEIAVMTMPELSEDTHRRAGRWRKPDVRPTHRNLTAGRP